MRTYAATDKLFLAYHPPSEERHIRLVTALSFSSDFDQALFRDCLFTPILRGSGLPRGGVVSHSDLLYLPIYKKSEYIGRRRTSPWFPCEAQM